MSIGNSMKSNAYENMESNPEDDNRLDLYDNPINMKK